jgi:hypothetical protein
MNHYSEGEVSNQKTKPKIYLLCIEISEVEHLYPYQNVQENYTSIPLFLRSSTAMQLAMPGYESTYMYSCYIRQQIL